METHPVGGGGKEGGEKEKKKTNTLAGRQSLPRAEEKGDVKEAQQEERKRRGERKFAILCFRKARREKGKGKRRRLSTPAHRGKKTLVW